MPSVFDFSVNCKLAMSRWFSGRIISTHLVLVLSILLNASNRKAIAAWPDQHGLMSLPSIFIVVPSGILPSVNKSKNIFIRVPLLAHVIFQ